MTTVDEWSTEFDILYNNITSNKAPGLTEYEKSVFLTRAQEEVVRSHFSRNQMDAGIDSSIERQEDFRSLFVTSSSTLSTTGTIDPRAKAFAYPSRIMFPINEQVFCHQGSTSGAIVATLAVKPLSFEEYTRLMQKPYKYPVKGTVWRLLNNTVTTAAAPVIKAELIAKFPTEYVEYSCRYVQKPYPIILQTFSNSDYADIDGSHTQTQCYLPEHLHNEILVKAVELAKSVWENRTGNKNQ